MKILVVGVGGVGSFLVHRLIQAGHEVSIVGRGKHLKAIQAHGLKIVGLEPAVLKPHACLDTPSSGPYDLVFLATKLGDLQSALTPCKSAGTQAKFWVPLQNGLQGSTMVEAAKLPGSVIPGIAYIDGSIQVPGQVHISTPGRLAFPLDCSPSFQFVFEELQKANIQVRQVKDFRRAQWTKLTWNSMFNPVAVLSQETVGGIKQDPALRTFTLNLFQEIKATAQKEGIALDPALGEQLLSTRDEAGSGASDTRTSMWADYAAGKTTEVNYLNGLICQWGKKHGVPTPYHEMVVTFIHALERNNPHRK